jgi:hypothetical protein
MSVIEAFLTFGLVEEAKSIFYSLKCKKKNSANILKSFIRYYVQRTSHSHTQNENQPVFDSLL